MAYSATADILKVMSEPELVQLSNDDAAATTADETNVAQAITDADEIIDGFVRGRYGVPLSPVPGLIKKLSVDIAVYHLWMRRRRAEMPEGIEKSYQNAVKLLEKIQQGKVLLSASELESGAETADGSGDIRVNKTADDRLFNKDTMDTY